MFQSAVKARNNLDGKTAKLIIFPAVKGAVEDGAAGQWNALDHGRYTRGHTQAMKVEPQAVAQVHAGSGPAGDPRVRGEP